jgi:polyisoprenoid-binding protein YceI
MTTMKRAIGLLVVAAVTVAAKPGPAAVWDVDPSHTEVGFSVNHFFTPVTGKFEEFDAQLRYDPERPTESTVDVAIRVASVNTNNERRDNHLLSEDFFEAAAHPEMTFRSTSVREVGPNRLVATGPLTIKGVTREIELPIEVLGIKEIPESMQGMLNGASQVASFRATTTLDRRDFGVGVGDWAATLIVGGEVDVEIVLEAAYRD